MSVQQQIEWLKSKGNQLIANNKKINLTVIDQCKILYDVHLAWHNSKISDEAKSFWNYDFYQWAKSFTQKRGKLPANITIDNQISVYRDYIAEELIEKPDKILVQKYDDKGIAINGEFEEIEPDFADCDYTKLLTARGSAKRREMTPETWGMLFDQKVSVTTMITAIKSTGQTIPSISLYERDGIIFASSNGETTALVGFIEDDKNSYLWQKGMEELLKNSKIHVPETMKELL